MEEKTSSLASYWAKRLQRLQSLLVQSSVDGIYVVDPNILRWLGYYEASQVLLLQQDVISGTVKELALHLDRPMNIGIDSRLSALHFMQLQQLAPLIRWQPQAGLLEQCILIKDEAALTVMREAARITRQILDHLKNLVREGVSELDLLTAAQQMMLTYEGCTFAFDPSISTGKRSALSWGGVTNYVLQPGDELLIDIGIALWGHQSDMTRSFCIEGGEQERYQIWQQAMSATERAFLQMCEHIRPGVRCDKLYQLGVQALKAAKIGKIMPYAFGHGIGMGLHEKPYLVPDCSDTLQVGMVLAIEPGLLLPSGGGVRYEEVVVVTEQGAEILA